MSVTDSIKKQIEDGAAELGRPVEYLPSSKTRKKDVAKRILEESPVDDDLICVLKTQELCKSAKVFGSDQGKLVLKTHICEVAFTIIISPFEPAI